MRFWKSQKFIIDDAKSNHSSRHLSVSLHAHVTVILESVFPLFPRSCTGLTLCKKFSPFRDYTRHKKKSAREGERTRMELPRRRESFTVIFEIIWDTFKGWARVQRAKGRKRGKNSIDIASRSPFRRENLDLFSRRIHVVSAPCLRILSFVQNARRFANQYRTRDSFEKYPPDIFYSAKLLSFCSIK